MALVRWNPIERSARVYRDDLESVLEDFFVAGYSPLWGIRPRRAIVSAHVPRIDIADSEKALVLKAEVPGFEKDDLDVTITRDAVTIKGGHKEEKEDSNECYYCRESAVGSFERRVPLPVEVNAEKAEAKLHNGVLTLVLPKAEAAGSVKIAVN